MFSKLEYSTGSNRKMQWSVNVINKGDFSEIITISGQIGGKMTTHSIIINKGKNTGKSNETDHYQQACNEAQSKWEKKKKSIENNIKPQLAKKFQDESHKLSYPVWVQPKLDGYRALYNPLTNSLTTRTGKDYNNVDELLGFLKSLNLGKIILDGELYNHNETFESLGSLRKKDGSNKNIIIYNVYDAIFPDDVNMVFSKRFKLLNSFIPNNKYVKIVETKQVSTKKEIYELHEKYLKNNYEGTMVRNDAMYRINKRTSDLLKLKDFDDDEYEIIGYSKEQDSLTGNELVVFLCKTDDNQSFSVGSKGSKEERAEILKDVQKHPENWIGKKITVQYFGLTENGIPRFPKTLRSIHESIRYT